MARASAIIIGNEILSGKTQDINSQFLARTLFESGVKLVLIETVPDKTDVIVSTVKRHSKEFDLVFTSGGIGPTHDDITYDAISKAFDRKLELHAETVKRYKDYYNREPNEARKKMAMLPEGATLFWTEGTWVPTVFLDPVYVLPGIPDLFAKMLSAIKPRFATKSFERVLVYTCKLEGDIAFDLERVQNRFPELEIGSYPQSGQVMLSIEGSNIEQVKLATAEIEKLV